MTLGFTGTRQGLTPIQHDFLHALLRRLHPGEVHHGDALGADAEFHALCARYLLPPDLHLHPCDLPGQRAYCGGPDNTIYEPRPPLERNHRIVEKAVVLVACPAGMREEQRSGTWATVRYARRLGRPVYLVWPSGKVTEERTATLPRPAEGEASGGGSR